MTNDEKNKDKYIENWNKKKWRMKRLKRVQPKRRRRNK